MFKMFITNSVRFDLLCLDQILAPETYLSTDDPYITALADWA